jgi:competence protein ComFC
MGKIFKSIVRPALRAVLALWLPPICSHCSSKRFGELPLCITCIRSLLRIQTPTCALCGTHHCNNQHPNWNPKMSSTRFLFLLNEPLTTLIHGFKYQHRLRNLKYLAAFVRLRPDLIEYIREFDALIPIPLHSLRKRERGYNQSAILAKELSRYTGVQVREDILIRKRYTNTQTRFGLLRRKINLQSAFGLNKNANLKAGKYLLVDDIFTTGSTAIACADLLKIGGAESTALFAIAKTDQKSPEKDYQMEMNAMAGFLT